MAGFEVSVLSSLNSVDSLRNRLVYYFYFLAQKLMLVVSSVEFMVAQTSREKVCVCK